MILHAPQFLFISLMILRLGVVCGRHGQPRTGEYDGSAAAFWFVAYSLILWWGGFFG